jgi:ADP-ribosylglycohydrolase/catechol 2,3-dioxygenase-like lactoylglutathione lyase family enzyme
MRRGGGRFFPHEEGILPGEYSDDTQLLLCVARSRLHGPIWWEHLVRSELPTWSLYERGGGGATKRAVDAWTSGHAPWAAEAKRSDRARYFEAGGNGVAMRIAPHCLVGARSNDFDQILVDVILDGIATHGHPRALVGAAAYGFALWIALRQTETLPYGDLIGRTISETPRWAKLPNEEEYPDLWRSVADEATQGGYEVLWEQTVREMVSLLEVAEQGLKQGALSVEREVLERMGTFDRKVNGAGTISAASAIFLASRYAADPVNGIIEAAYATGADTDTIASMTGAILGGLAGPQGMQELFDGVQDAPYLRQLADQLATPDLAEVKPHAIKPVTRSDLQRFLNQLKSAVTGAEVNLPDGRRVTTKGQEFLRSRSGATVGTSWRLVTSDNQSLCVKSLSRAKDAAGQAGDTGDRAPEHPSLVPQQAVTCRVKLMVDDLDRSASFYSQVFGLKATRRTPKYVHISDTLILVPRQYEAEMMLDSADLVDFPKPKATIISLGVPSLGSVQRRLEGLGVRLLTRAVNRAKHSFFRCLDPDGNIVEVFEL